MNISFEKYLLYDFCCFRLVVCPATTKVFTINITQWGFNDGERVGRSLGYNYLRPKYRRLSLSMEVIWAREAFDVSIASSTVAIPRTNPVQRRSRSVRCPADTSWLVVFLQPELIEDFVEYRQDRVPDKALLRPFFRRQLPACAHFVLTFNTIYKNRYVMLILLRVIT